MTQEDLAAACELDRTYIGGIERGGKKSIASNLRRRTTESEIDDDVLLLSKWPITAFNATIKKVPECPITDILYT